ncbi:hypothetical protein [Donghicola mangrovi]|uniref:Response regulatory domain-containing protein n=1 Tax=Donghicola mangrovi TaxID=2729614 RepID=A0A850Q8K5_9RHOB|nr:hypothetical protein [Donghicola mangrovi]NVO24562.1 hypothetical protein [Donghicola mangrovi]
MLISIIEDDALHLQILTRWLLKSGKYQVQPFETSEDFFNHRQASGDVERVLILDACVEGALSCDLIHQIRRSSGEASCVGIVLASSLPDPQNANVIETCDIDAFLNKDHINPTGLEIAITLAARSGSRRRHAMLRNKALSQP